MKTRLSLQIVLVWVLLAVMTACNTTKFVPQGEYLLNDVKVRVQDTKTVASSDLVKYVQQRENTEILGFWKLQLAIYNTASLDTAKWTSKNARKIGEAPVVFSSELADASMVQLGKAMKNKGYFRAQVDTAMSVKDRKVNLVYNIVANEPYMISDYQVDFRHPELLSIATNERLALVSAGDQFDADILNQERQRVASAMRRLGCYYFDAECVRFLVDSMRMKQQLDVVMCLHPRIEEMTDEEQARLFRKYTINQVCFHMDYDMGRTPEDEDVYSSWI